MRHADALLALKQARESVAAARSTLAAAQRRLEQAGSALRAAEEEALLALSLLEEKRFIGSAASRAANYRSRINISRVKSFSYTQVQPRSIATPSGVRGTNPLDVILLANRCS
jgi:hypothetical protein